MNEPPFRKPNRLRDYDYSQNGAYFITVCAKERQKLFGSIDNSVGAASCRLRLSKIGEIVAAEILRLSQTYDGVAVDRHVVMPNHVHLLITIFDSNGRQDAAPTVARFNNNGRQNAAPAVSRMIGQWKRAVSMKAGFSPWQKSFHDHVIRNEQDYLHIVEYIENNPLNWSKDCFFVGEGS